MFCERPRRLIRSSSARPWVSEVSAQASSIASTEWRVGVGGAEAQRVGGEQAQDGEAGALLLEQLGAGGAGEGQGEVADPQADHLRVADRG